MPDLRTLADLHEAGLISTEQQRALTAVADKYAIGLTEVVQSWLIESVHDPIARQFLPDPRELLVLPQERIDPIGDDAHSPVKGIVHRYPDRVLLKALHLCPVYCRFCFRREKVGHSDEALLSPQELEAALNYIEQTPAIWEVILTGGDPLLLSPRRLAQIADRLDAITHVKILRLHSRVPAVAPHRIDEACLKSLRRPHLMTFIALHANHPRELTPQTRATCRKIIDSGISMLSQSVLLKGVNDDVEILGQLFRAFVETGIKPYYLHHPDLAPGTSHFRLSIAEGQALVAALRGRLSGLCQPTYVLDIPGGYGKTPLGPRDIDATKAQTQLTDFQGQTHRYQDQF